MSSWMERRCDLTQGRKRWWAAGGWWAEWEVDTGGVVVPIYCDGAAGYSFGPQPRVMRLTAYNLLY